MMSLHDTVRGRVHDDVWRPLEARARPGQRAILHRFQELFGQACEQCVTEVHDGTRRVWQTDRVSEERSGRMGRSDWLQVDLRCLMCGRVAGQLVGRRPPATTAGVAGGKPSQFDVFRPADSAAPTLRLVGGEQFRCGTCGGRVLMDQVEAFTAYVDVDEEVEEGPRRGRPARPWRRSTVVSPEWMRDLVIFG